MPAPTPDALRFAAEWLREYEDAQDETRAAEVADWLDSQAEAAELRAVARELGVSVNRLRQNIAAFAAYRG